MIWAQLGMGALVAMVFFRTVSQSLECAKRLSGRGLPRLALARREFGISLGSGFVVIIIGAIANSALLRWIGLGLEGLAATANVYFGAASIRSSRAARRR